jgi:hypothetical protein
MIQESTYDVVVHGTHLAYVAVLPESLCREAHLLAQHELGVHPVLSEDVIEGIKRTGKNDKELSWPLHSANSGVTLHPQTSTQGSLNQQTQLIDASIGLIIEGYVKTSACFFPHHTFIPVVQPIYDNKLFPAFLLPLAKEDNFYGD